MRKIDNHNEGYVEIPGIDLCITAPRISKLYIENMCAVLFCTSLYQGKYYVLVRSKMYYVDVSCWSDVQFADVPLS
jgi:hypothetical protein